MKIYKDKNYINNKILKCICISIFLLLLIFLFYCVEHHSNEGYIERNPLDIIHGTFKEDEKYISFDVYSSKIYLYLPNLNINEKTNFELLDETLIYFNSNSFGECLCLFEEDEVKLIRINPKQEIAIFTKNDYRVLESIN